MLEKVTLETFEPLVGQGFSVEPDAGNPLDLTLASAKAWGSASAGGRQPFTLTFHGPLEPVLPQRMYRFRHTATGALELFIVPVGPEPGRAVMRYEAVFS